MASSCSFFCCFRRAAAQRDPNGFINLGTCYLRGLGCKADLSLAFACFKAAASFPDAGNITIDPKFRTVDGLPYYPGAAKCRNSGLKFDWMEDPADPRSKDVYGNARIQGSAPDMGAAECVSLGLMLLFR